MLHLAFCNQKLKIWILYITSIAQLRCWILGKKCKLGYIDLSNSLRYSYLKHIGTVARVAWSELKMAVSVTRPYKWPNSLIGYLVLELWNEFLLHLIFLCFQKEMLWAKSWSVLLFSRYFFLQSDCHQSSGVGFDVVTNICRAVKVRSSMESKQLLQHWSLSKWDHVQRVLLFDEAVKLAQSWIKITLQIVFRSGPIPASFRIYFLHFLVIVYNRQWWV